MVDCGRRDGLIKKFYFNSSTPLPILVKQNESLKPHLLYDCVSQRLGTTELTNLIG